MKNENNKNLVRLGTFLICAVLTVLSGMFLAECWSWLRVGDVFSWKLFYLLFPAVQFTQILLCTEFSFLWFYKQGKLKNVGESGFLKALKYSFGFFPIFFIVGFAVGASLPGGEGWREITLAGIFRGLLIGLGTMCIWNIFVGGYDEIFWGEKRGEGEEGGIEEEVGEGEEG